MIVLFTRRTGSVKAGSVCVFSTKIGLVDPDVGTGFVIDINKTFLTRVIVPSLSTRTGFIVSNNDEIYCFDSSPRVVVPSLSTRTGFVVSNDDKIYCFDSSPVTRLVHTVLSVDFVSFHVIQ